MKIRIREQTCHLLPARAVYWEEQETLILADIHLGKDTVFRKAGIAVPEGTMQEDLCNISRLLVDLKPKKCLIVGDLIHAKSGLSPAVRHLFSNWLHQTTCEIHLIMGNHDYALAKSLPKEWPLYLHCQPLLIKPFYFSHFPEPHPDWFVWSGHIHPKVELKNAKDRLVLRCFQLFSNLAILPAFSSFVGGTFVKKEKGCRLFGIVDTQVILL